MVNLRVGKMKYKDYTKSGLKVLAPSIVYQNNILSTEYPTAWNNDNHPEGFDSSLNSVESNNVLKILSPSGRTVLSVKRIGDTRGYH